MILKQLLDVYKKQVDLKGVKIAPYGVEGISECVIYEFVPRLNDGIMRQDSFKLRVNAFTYVRAEQLYNILTKAYITQADDRLTDSITEVTQNGGGAMYNEETKLHTLTLNLNIKSKVR